MNLQYTGVGTRVLNFCIDTPFVFLLAFIANKTYSWYRYYYHIKPINFWLIYAAATFVFYFIFEVFFSKTPGKWFTQTKVVNKEGRKASLLEILIRSLSRIIVLDPFFIPFLNKPLHDYLSKTELIQE